MSTGMTYKHIQVDPALWISRPHARHQINALRSDADVGGWLNDRMLDRFSTLESPFPKRTATFCVLACRSAVEPWSLIRGRPFYPSNFREACRFWACAFTTDSLAHRKYFLFDRSM